MNMAVINQSIDIVPFPGCTTAKEPPPQSSFKRETPSTGLCPGLLERLYLFNQLQANNAILHYIMVRLKTF
jgi:hypothetical protein